MLARLRRAGRRYAALVWGLVLLFAIAPAVSTAFATPVGAFSRVLVHSHEHSDEEHFHHGHHHRHDGHHHHHDDATHDGHDDQGQHGMHVHWDASCPSVLIPAPITATLDHRVADRVTIPPVEPMQSAPPNRLLRPPIPSSLL